MCHARARTTVRVGQRRCDRLIARSISSCRSTAAGVVTSWRSWPHGQPQAGPARCGWTRAVSTASNEPRARDTRFTPTSQGPVERANQAWASVISYIAMAKGFMYLVADHRYSRRVLSWRVSNTLDTDFCIEALEEALQRFEARRSPTKGPSSPVKRSLLKDHAIASAWMARADWCNVFVERLWRKRQVRGRVPAGLRNAHRASGRTGPLLRFLQHQASQWTDAPPMRCTSTRLTAIWQPETRGTIPLHEFPGSISVCCPRRRSIRTKG